MTAFPGDMFLRDYLAVTTEEYSSSSIAKPYARVNKIDSGELKFSFFRLSVAAAKSILTSTPQSKTAWKQVRASFYNLDSIVEHASLNLRLTNGFRREYRDFSKTSRTGELAQAITFLLAQDALMYPVVMDFDGYLSSQGIPAIPSDEKTPDYALLFGKGTSHLSLIESKGSCPDTNIHQPKGPLSKALKQCESADNHIYSAARYRARNTYGTHVRFSESLDSWDTVAAFCDPEEPAANELLDPMGALRHYYSAWFVLGGYFRHAGLVARGELTDMDVKRWGTLTYQGHEYLIPDAQTSSTMFTPFLAFRSLADQPNIPKGWAIHAKLIYAIMREDISAVHDLFSQGSEAQTDFEKKIVTFRDFTLCFWGD
ncbi:hypothetical protein OKW40_003667 [Paraburkholderia sp. RAU6.4a]|uniref:hypothetical protein n=1 Tax=Paraburkholderia sp. RAU6.4a TaxID=2991067 RepID=UPI003D2557B1